RSRALSVHLYGTCVYRHHSDRGHRPHPLCGQPGAGCRVCGNHRAGLKRLANGEAPCGRGVRDHARRACDRSVRGNRHRVLRHPVYHGRTPGFSRALGPLFLRLPPRGAAPRPARSRRDAPLRRAGVPPHGTNECRSGAETSRRLRMPNVTTKDVIKVYRAGKSEVIALRGLDMAVSDRELVAVRGPSGCGKTTLLNLLGGIDRPTAGRIEVNGSNLVDLSDAELVRYRLQKVGFIFQFFNLVPTLTAEENVELPMRLAGKGPSARSKRTKELLELVGMKKRAVHRPDELRGGEQQRMAIGDGLSYDLSLLFVDCTTGGLLYDMEYDGH